MKLITGNVCVLVCLNDFSYKVSGYEDGSFTYEKYQKEIKIGSYTGFPEVTIHHGLVSNSKYHEGGTYFGAVTVGGVTTGGTYTTPDTYTQTYVDSGRGYLSVDDNVIKEVYFSTQTQTVFKRNKDFKQYVQNGIMRCTVETERSSFAPYIPLMTKTISDNERYVLMQDYLSREHAEHMLLYYDCEKMLSILQDLKELRYPRTDESLYFAAVTLLQSDVLDDVSHAIEAFDEIVDYKDSAMMKKAAKEKLQKLKEEKKKENEHQIEIREEKKGRLIWVLIPVILFLVLPALLFKNDYLYARGTSLMNQGKTGEAMYYFSLCGNYRDAGTLCDTYLMEVLDGAKGTYKNGDDTLYISTSSISSTRIISVHTRIWEEQITKIEYHKEYIALVFEERHLNYNEVRILHGDYSKIILASPFWSEKEIEYSKK